MKKLLIIFICLFLLVGCKDKDEKGPNGGNNGNGEVSAKQLLENKLLEYGKKIYENDTWTKGGLEPFTYYTTLDEMQTTYGFDISMFVNEETKRACDKTQTRIEFVVTSEKKATKTEYTLKPVVVCE